MKGRNRLKIGSNNTFMESVVIDVGYSPVGQKVIVGNGNVIACQSMLISHGGTIAIGNGNFIGERVQIQGRGGVVIGDHCQIAANTFISSSNHKID